MTPETITREFYCHQLKQRMGIFYKKIGSVYCPALNKRIVFNSKGFYHLTHKSNGQMRTTKEKIHKLTLLPLAIKVIKTATNIFERRILKSDKNTLTRSNEYYALVATVGKKRSIQIRVIIYIARNNLNPIFLSVMKHV